MEHSELKNERGYSLLMRVLHWLMALIMITMIAAGIYMVQGPWEGKFPAERGMLYDYHRGMGFVLIVLVIIRLVVSRLSTPPSPLPSSISPMQQRIAHSVHFLMYAAMLLHPLFGWIATNLWGVKHIPIFGLFNLPQLVEKDRELGNILLAWHGWIGIGIAVLIGLHILGVVYHQFILKDHVLQRMLRTHIPNE
jgi:cytochrome b561